MQMTSRLAVRAIGLLVIAEALLIFAPLIILGAAIEWPASLDFPPAMVLPMILEHLDQVRLGYGIYLLYSLLWIVVGASVAWLANGQSERPSVLVSLAISLGVASALARAIGIIRWLTASTDLAETYAAPQDPVAQRAIEIAQTAVNSWGGSIGEVLGVALLASAWLFTISLLIVTKKHLPPLLGYIGFVTAIIVALPACELFGFEGISIAMTTTAMHIWLLALGVIIIRQTWTKPKVPALVG